MTRFLHNVSLINHTVYLKDEAVVTVGVGVAVDRDAADNGERLVGLVDGAAVLEAFGLP